MGKHENGMCDECDVLDTVEHMLFKCGRYDDQRKSILSFFCNIKNRPMSFVDLLGKYLRDNQVYMPVLTILQD